VCVCVCVDSSQLFVEVYDIIWYSIYIMKDFFMGVLIINDYCFVAV